LSAGYYDAYYQKAQQVRRLIRERVEALFTNYDLILTPVAPTPAFKIGENMQDPLVMYMADIFTVLPSLSGIPSIAVPLGNNRAGLPLSLQLSAKHFNEELLLAFTAGFKAEAYT
jgi:aspartyl-tRNA(Asn)/glutamyl-tRNA(Gln) amidotransferase subunit A